MGALLMETRVDARRTKAPMQRPKGTSNIHPILLPPTAFQWRHRGLSWKDQPRYDFTALRNSVNQDSGEGMDLKDCWVDRLIFIVQKGRSVTTNLRNHDNI